MKIQVLGGHGGLASGFATTSFLIDDRLLIDAGNVAGPLSVAEQAKIDYILISHCHLDHIKDLAFISDNCFGMRPQPFEVYTHATVKELIKKHFLNDTIWPDFTALPTVDNPTMRITAVEPEQRLTLGEYRITPVKVNHQHDAMGFVIEREGKSVLFTSDTGPTERIWEVAKSCKNLQAIFTEVSFPNQLQNVADVSLHHTAQTLKVELEKMPKEIPVVLTHLKPGFRQQIMQEIESLGEPRIRVLEKDGEIFNY